MNTPEVFYNVAGIVLWLTAIPALWIGRRILLKYPLTEDRSTYLFLWFVLGGFFRIPLVDILTDLANLIAQIIPSDELAVRTGLLRILVNLFIYAFAIYFGQKIIAKHDLPLSLTSLERGFIVLGMAGLFHYLIADLIGNFILVTFQE